MTVDPAAANVAIGCFSHDEDPTEDNDDRLSIACQSTWLLMKSFIGSKTWLLVLIALCFRTTFAVRIGETGIGQHTCAFEPNKGVKCWGLNSVAQLGLGIATTQIGNLPNQMGEYLPLVDTGIDVTDITGVVTGQGHTCVLATVEGTNRTKCWGINSKGQLGYGDTIQRGFTAESMGANLPFVDIGIDFVLRQIATGGSHTCALLYNSTQMTKNQIKCWGRNDLGQLGVGDNTNRGVAPNQMGLNLSSVDLGVGFEPVDVILGDWFSCALSARHTVKCWGYNGYGQLGYGDTNSRGDNSGEMGDNLPLVELGANFNVSQLAAGSMHACALSTAGAVKCWGRNNYGQLGYGDTNDRGYNSGAMGANLDIVSLGTGFVAMQIALQSYSSCARSTNNSIKCWGSNAQGGLGYGDTDNRGIAPIDMGDALGTVNLGTGFTPMHIEAGYAHTCAVSTLDQVKCWGYNSFGELGIGASGDRGDAPGEMGDSLPFVDLAFPTIAPSIYPTISPSNPTAYPTIAPTTYPTITPSKNPTTYPTINPSKNPTRYPSANPTTSPTKYPSANPTTSPTKYPSANPTRYPSTNPTTSPTKYPSANPTNSPTKYPSANPTRYPSANPTKYPSTNPTTATANPSAATMNPSAATVNPSATPTLNPSTTPTLNPSGAPTLNPSQNPSVSPTRLPSYSPTIHPTTDSPTANPSIGPTAHPTAYHYANYECDEIPFILVIYFQISTAQAYDEDDLISILITVMVDTIKSLIDTPWNSGWCVDLRKSNLIVNIGSRGRRLLQNTVHYNYKATFNFNDALKTAVFDDDDFSFGRFKKDLSDNMEERVSDTILTEDEGEFTMDSGTDVKAIAKRYREPFFDFTDPLMIALMVLIGFSVSIMVGGKLHAHVVSADDFRLGPVFLFTIYVWDFYTDLLFALSLYTCYVSAAGTDYVSEDAPAYTVLLIASIVFLVCPLAKNFYDLLQFEDVWREHPILSDLYKTWLRDYGQYVNILSFLCGSTYAAINLVNSNFLGMRAFSMGLSRVDVLKFNQKRLLNVVLLENLPQLIIQVFFAYLTEQITDIALLAIASSAVSIFLAILNHINHQKHMDDEKVTEVMFSFKLFESGKNDLNYKGYMHKTHAVSKAIEQALDLTPRTVECLPINTTVDGKYGAGLEINCVIRTTKKKPIELKNELIALCDMDGDSDDSGCLLLRKRIASQWEMTGQLITVFDPKAFHEEEPYRKSVQFTNMKTPGGDDTVVSGEGEGDIIYKDDDNAPKLVQSVNQSALIHVD